jgi:hypothetical protein
MASFFDVGIIKKKGEEGTYMHGWQKGRSSFRLNILLSKVTIN